MDADTHAQTAEDETLTPDCVIDILEDIFPARIKSFNLGLKLMLPPDIVQVIHAKTQSADDHLRDVVEAFLKEVGSRPTWRVIIDALKSPTINLQQLAKKLEDKHGFVTQEKEHTSGMYHSETCSFQTFAYYYSKFKVIPILMYP